MRKSNYGYLVAIAVVALLLGICQTASAARVGAVAGRPFGVGMIEITLAPRDVPRPLGYDGLAVSDRDGRVFYPAVEPPPDNQMVKDLINKSPLGRGGPIREGIGAIINQAIDAPPTVKVYFLFRGDEPLDLRLEAARPIPFRVRPIHDPRAHDRLLAAWWAQYAASPGMFEKKPEYPPLVENYLVSMLARRLRLELPEKKQTPQWQSELEQYLGVALGTESIRLAMMQDRILGLNNLDMPANEPLPPAQSLPDPYAFQAPPTPTIEPTANRVPAECFYIRFGSFSNLLWFQDTLAKWGGDVQNLVSVRGLDHGMNERIQQQLVLKQDLIGRLFGDAVIADVALIGTDLFFREGGAYGMLFHARQSGVLGSSFSMNRREKVNSGEATERKFKVAGVDVSYLKSPDGRIRSYYVVDGAFHLVTTSRFIAERFIATGAGKAEGRRGATGATAGQSGNGTRGGKSAGRARPLNGSAPVLPGNGSLAALPEFHLARTLMPVDRGYTLFVYFSRPFLETLASPHYRVEMARRLQSHADIELVRLAVLNAAAEGKPGGTIEQLKAAHALPLEFGPRPDSSRTVLTPDGEVYDDLRGHSGAFLPIPDTPVDRVTRAEASSVARFQQQFREKWGGHMDPIIVGVARGNAAGSKGPGREIDSEGGGTPGNVWDGLFGTGGQASSGTQSGDQQADASQTSGEIERVTVDVRMRPFSRQHYERLSQVIGPPVPDRVAPIAGNIASFEAMTAIGRLFGGVRDVVPPGSLGPLSPGARAGAGAADVPRSSLRNTNASLLAWRLRDFIVGYLGTKGAQGPLSSVNAWLAGPERLRRPIGERLGLWRRQRGDWTVLSFQQEVLLDVMPQLRLVPDVLPAQLRVDVGDIWRSQVTPLVNRLSYVRTRETSLSNLRLLHQLDTQLHVPPEAAREAAEFLLGARLYCPLGGDYKLVRTPAGQKQWTSTAFLPDGARLGADAGLPNSAGAVPEDYQAPPLRWFRGMTADAIMNRDQLAAHIELTMERPKELQIDTSESKE